jgi:adenylyl-sulfate kinase
MRRFKFRIGTKLGLTAGIGVILVGGMLTSQLISSEQIAELSRMVVINTANKANAQAAGAAMTRARLAVVEISVAKSADRLAAHSLAFRKSVAEATTEIDAALNRARREEAKQLYREVKTNIEASLKAGAELGEARGKVIAGLAAGSPAGEIMKAEEAGTRVLEQKMLPATKEIGFTSEARVENIRRTAEIAALFVDAGMIALVSLISPFRGDRDMARHRLDDGEFIEIHVATSLSECERRDPKGLYVRARAGELPNFTGIDQAYEAPQAPEITIDTKDMSAEAACERIVAYLQQHRYL